MSMRKILKILLRLFKSRRVFSAFTLIELIVAGAITLVILTAAMDSMINVLNSERQEGILTQTQQDMERAMKYIVGDVEQAAYVYDFSTTITCPSTSLSGLPGTVQPYPLCFLPNFGNGATPIIAFWKVVPLTDSVVNGLVSSTSAPISGTCSNSLGLSTSTYIPEASTSGTTDLTYQAECNALLYKRKMYSLVIYYQTGNSSPSTTTGYSQIWRYELSKYNPTVTPVTRNNGFIDPAYTNNFPTWPFSSTSSNTLQTSNPTTSTGNPAVLVNFVDSPIASVSGLPSCPSGTNRIPANTISSPTYSNTNLSEAQYTTGYSNSFFVCVTPNPTTSTTSSSTGQIQIVSVYLRGNALGKTGLQNISSINNTVLPALRTTVNIRGNNNETF